MKLKSIIVDDEPVARKIIRQFAGQVNFLDVAGEYENVLKADAYLQNENMDLIFLDIEMPKLSGISYLNTASTKLPLVIITTAFPEFALDGYRFDVIDYLLKPISFERFYKAVQKAKEYHELKHKYVLSGSAAKYVFVKADKRIEKIELDDILYIKSIGNYITIFTEAKTIMTYMTLKSIEKQLPSQEFIKIHQSYLVHIKKVDWIDSEELKIKNLILPIGRSYKESVINAVEKKLLKRI